MKLAESLAGGGGEVGFGLGYRVSGPEKMRDPSPESAQSPNLLTTNPKPETRNPIPPPRSRQRHQTIFVSATISDEIEKLAARYMREPVENSSPPARMTSRPWRGRAILLFRAASGINIA